MKVTKTFSTIYRKNSLWGNLILGVLLIIVVRCVYNKMNPLREGFLYTDRYVFKQGPDVFDDFYANYYDSLVFSHSKNLFEIGEIITISNLSEHSKVLDIGAGTGHHVALLAEHNIPVIGLDSSQAMINYAKNTYPSLNFKLGNALDAGIYPGNSFTHILCLQYTLYYMKNKRKFFVHLVDKKNFDPATFNGTVDIRKTHPANNKYAKTVMELRDYTYSSNFLQDDNEPDTYYIKEKFADKKNNVRENEHILYMNTQKHILGVAKQEGFILLGQIDMSPLQHDYQYIYILQKPN